MYEYESKELDREKLEYLRKNTFLGPIAMFKIARAKLILAYDLILKTFILNFHQS